MPHPTCAEFTRLNRRQMLGACSAGLLGLSLPDFLCLRSRAAGQPSRDGFGRAKSCIVLYCW